MIQITTPISVIERALRYVTGTISLGADDVLLASYPRSGNTWVRFFFANLINVVEGDESQVTHSVVDRMMPELGVDSLTAAWESNTVPRIIKTHAEYSPFFFRPRKVFLARDPRDVMVSYYHYLRDRKEVYEGVFSQFLRSGKYGLEAWCRHYLSWTSVADHRLSYESMLDDDLGSFSCLVSRLNLSVPSEAVREATERSRFERLSKLEDGEEEAEPGNDKPQRTFFRSGGKSDWQSYATERDALYLTNVLSEYGIPEYT